MQFLDDVDPSLEGGFEIAFEQEVPLELRQDASDKGTTKEVGSLESIKVKVLILPAEGQQKRQYQTIKIELTSESDLFFYYVSIIEEETFQETQSEQGIKIKFEEYLTWMIKLLNQCWKDPHHFSGIFLMQSEGIARLDFIENMDYKFLEIISLDFIANPEDLVKQNVIYRHNVLKAKTLFVQGRLEDISNLIRLKNPSLLVQIQRNSLGSFAYSSLQAATNSKQFK